MKILALGDSWTYGEESSDPTTKSWPAQLAHKHSVRVVNLAKPGAGMHQAMRLGIQELSANNDYDWVVLPLPPANRLEILNQGKWHSIWPSYNLSKLDRVFVELWHPWNDLQSIILACVQFVGFVNLIGAKLLITSLSLRSRMLWSQLNWIKHYANDYDFEKLGMPLTELNDSIENIDHTLRSLRAMHELLLQHQPDYLYDVELNYLMNQQTRDKYGTKLMSQLHPNDQGYLALADYFAHKIGLN